MTTALNRYPNMCGWWHDTARTTFRVCMRADGHNGAHLAEDGSMFVLEPDFVRQGLACEELPPRSPGVPYRGPRLPCVGRPDHSGEHADASGRTWANDHADCSTDEHEDTSTDHHEDASTGTNTEGSPMTSTGRHVSTVTDAHVTRLHTLLSTPGVVTQAVRKLGDTDRTFSMLDIALRRGAPVPARWAVSVETVGDDREREHADELYDALSSTLRETGNASTCLAALREAVRAWEALDGHLVDGGVLPSPWSR